MTLLFASFIEVIGVPNYFAYIFIFLLGCCVGSFLNVVIHRIPNQESIVFPNSTCPKCGNKIKPYDNIPIISWLLLRGKCRGCSEPISIRYPAVELLTGLLWLLFAFVIGATPLLPVGLIFVSTMIALMFIDAGHMILPNVITYPLTVAAFIVRIAFASAFGLVYFADFNHTPATMMMGSWPVLIALVNAILGALAGGGLLWLLGEVWKRLRGVEAMGLGDVKMMAGVGALLGWQLSLLAIFLGAFSGALIGIVVMAKQKDRDMQTQIPFGIFLGMGSIAAFLFGEKLLTWYLGKF